MKQIFLFILLVIIPFITVKSQDGEMVAITFQSSSIENNLIGESAEINVGVFLPPGYYEKLSKRYPVIYWLHGFSGWKNTSGKSGWDEERINSLIKKMISGEIKPMIIVMPDSSNKFGGSFYANSVTTGNWEDLIAFEVPGFIDKNYRTLPKASLSTSQAGRSDLRPLISPESQYNLGHSRGIELLRNRDHALPCLIHFLRGHTQIPFRYRKYTKCWTCQDIRFLGQRRSPPTPDREGGFDCWLRVELS